MKLRALAVVPLLALGALLPTPAGAAPAPHDAARATVPVLGSASYRAPVGEGWGTAHPRHVFNGGDPAGDVSRIHWQHWGATRAVGRGLIPIFRPGGGYYARPGRIVLRAQTLGTCPDGTHAYTRLYFRVAHRPDGPVGKHWHAWSGDPDICGTPQ